MRRNLFCLTLVFISILVNAQNDLIVNQFLKDISKTKHYPIKKIDSKKLEWTDNDIYGDPEFRNFVWSIRNDSVKKYLTEEDFSFIEAQYKANRGSLWLDNELKSFQLIGQSELDKITQRSMKGHRPKSNYNHAFSMPFFSADGNYAIIKEQFNCGFMCSTWCTVLYTRSKDRKGWTKVLQWTCIST